MSTDHDFTDLTLVVNTTQTRYKLPKDRLKPGQIYYVGVALVDGPYVSTKAGPIPLEAAIPAQDLIVSPSGVAGVLVPIFIVIAVLGSVVAYYAYRNRRLKRNFAAFASRYSPATGAAILNTVSLKNNNVTKLGTNQYSYFFRVHWMTTTMIHLLSGALQTTNH